MNLFRAVVPAVSLCLLLAVATASLAAPQTAPPPGLRETTLSVHAIVGAKIVVSPQRTIERGTLVLRDGVIVAVGENVTPPADARIWNAEGKTLYPGFIDAYSELSADASRAGRNDAAGAAYWNGSVVPQVRGDLLYTSDAAANRKFRSQGITTRLVAPSVGIIKGTSALVSTGDGPGKKVVLKDQVALHVRLTVTRGTSGYPNSPMGAYTLVRQAFYDAGWYGHAWDAYRQNPELPRPERSDALALLRQYLGRKSPVIIDAGDVLYALRAGRIAEEFELNAIIRGSGEEYRRLEEVKATGRPVIVPVSLPRAPNVATPEAAMNVDLERLMHWDLAPENAARLDAAGVKIALTSFGLGDRDSFLTALRKVVQRGLSPEAALTALTVTPAELFDSADRLGTLEVGKAANVLVTTGPIFESKTKVLETWVDGERFENESPATLDLRGTWSFDAAPTGGESKRFRIELKGRPDKLTGTISSDDKSTPLIAPNLSEHQFNTAFKGTPLGLEGVVQITATVSLQFDEKQGEQQDKTASAKHEPTWLGTIVWSDGGRTPFSAERTAEAKPKAEFKDDGPAPASKDAEAKENAPKEEAAKARDSDTPESKEPQPPAPDAAAKPSQPTAPPVPQTKGEPVEDKTIVKPPKVDPPATKEQIQKTPDRAISEVNFPLGAFGRSSAPEQPKHVLFRNATLWTSGPQGKLERTDLLIESGKISAIGKGLEVPEGTLVIDASEKHLTPGIIDCHSHAATDGGINESGQTITAEVRIGDFIDPTDINIYRQLAGGVTAANILHGSANTIGGQNQVVKFRWGARPEEMKFADAPPGIKFALGENVKQSNRTDRGPGRYPQSRMGVEQLLRDAFRAAKAYRQGWDKWNRTKVGLPPRIDLELEALAEVVEGKRLVHCHSYRQDEILAMLRACESFDVKVATLQHILEGYKVADLLSKHGAGASSFSDWWGYKFEVFDAIPYNGALLHGAGVVVSFNSDDAELARRLNLEAAKAIKYGGVSPEAALKFVTLNPAKQLRIDQRVGSLEVGKDADLVVWSGPPLSSYSRCEQTWVDGRRYFDLNEDKQLRADAAALRAKLIQRILSFGDSTEDAEEAKKDTWPRVDIFCTYGAHGY